MNLAHVLVDASRDYAGRPVLHQGEGTVTFDQLEQRARTAAAQLRELGIGAGDRVALKLPNGPAFAAAWFGTLQLGAIVVPLNVLLARPEVDERMRISGARLLVDDAAFFDSELEPMPDVADCGACGPCGHPLHLRDFGAREGCRAHTRRDPVRRAAPPHALSG